MTRVKPLLVVVPVYGEVAMTHELMADLAREEHLAEVVVVDNRGDYDGTGWERIVRPGANLGWAGGTNLGTQEGRRSGTEAVVWLNNDTRLAGGFLASLRAASRTSGAAVLSPLYDCHWLHQRADGATTLAGFAPRRVHLHAPFVDGTCMVVPARTIDDIGLLDDVTFAPLGWGAEIDYCLRARAAGKTVAVTRQAFLHHERSVTASSMFDDYDTYFEEAYPAAVAGLEQKWGVEWRTKAGIDDTSQTVGLDQLRAVVPRPLSRLGLPLVRSRSPYPRP